MGKLLRMIALCLVLIVPQACKKGGCNVVPDVIINRIPFSTTQYPSLAGINGHAMLQGGVSGIIVVRTSHGFIAYDRCSTVDPDKRCAVEVNEDNPLVAVDPCSQAEYILLNGSPAKIAECPLKPYRVQQVGTGPGALYYIVN